MKTINKGSIKDFTTYKLSGTINKIVFPENIAELKETLCNLKDYKYKIIGNGSNLIISEDYTGTFISLKYFDSLEFKDNLVSVFAGYSLPKLVRKCIEKGLSGLEFACGIPGSVGGAIYMNAGAYGFEIKDVVKEVTVIDSNLKVYNLNRKDLKYGYRDSIFKNNDLVILSVVFELKYGDSQQMLAEVNKIMASRREKQPLEFPSAGSVFRNPDGMSAGRLIEKSGLKGLSVGGAQVALKHANFIINKDGATAEDVIKLIELVQKQVKEKFNVDLELEQEIIKG